MQLRVAAQLLGNLVPRWLPDRLKGVAPQVVTNLQPRGLFEPGPGRDLGGVEPSTPFACKAAAGQRFSRVVAFPGHRQQGLGLSQYQYAYACQAMGPPTWKFGTLHIVKRVWGSRSVITCSGHAPPSSRACLFCCVAYAPQHIRRCRQSSSAGLGFRVS